MGRWKLWKRVCYLVCFAQSTSFPCQADEYEAAVKAAAKAYYKYSDLDERAKELERIYVPKELKKYSGAAAAIAGLYIDQRIVFKWSIK